MWPEYKGFLTKISRFFYLIFHKNFDKYRKFYAISHSKNLINFFTLKNQTLFSVHSLPSGILKKASGRLDFIVIIISKKF